MKLEVPETGKHSGLAINLAGLGVVRLAHMLAHNTETAVYYTDHPGVVVKVFDLSCAQAGEVSYGPFASFRSELANFEEVLKLDALRTLVPAYFGAHIDYEAKHAYIALEYLEGKDLRAWSEELGAQGYPAESLEQLQAAIHETLQIIDTFHRHGVLLIDFKPENAIRLERGGVKFVDLGALFTPRHRRDLASFVYAATPDHAEVMIDASNLLAGVPPAEASDTFSAGVALFEMTTGASRLEVDPQTAEDILANSSTYLFRDSQIRDVWKAFPHLVDVLPLVQTQLRERRLLFSEIWHLLKAYLGLRVPDWESLEEAQRDQILLATGTTFIMEQLPEPVAWLAGPIARATILRSLRPKTMSELLPFVGAPLSDAVLETLHQNNCLVRYVRSLELPLDFLTRLNTWELRADPASGHPAIAAGPARRQLADVAEFIFLKRSAGEEDGHQFWHVVDESDADVVDDRRMTLQRLQDHHGAWVGAAAPSGG